MDRVVLCVRVSEDKRKRLTQYARTHDLVVNDVVNSLIDQLLVQVDPTFETPQYLADYVCEANTLDTGTTNHPPGQCG